VDISHENRNTTLISFDYWYERTWWRLFQKRVVPTR